MTDAFAVCSFMAWNWYPPVKEEDQDLPPRLHGHADMDVITLLYQRTGNRSTCIISRTALQHAAKVGLKACLHFACTNCKNLSCQHASNHTLLLLLGHSGFMQSSCMHCQLCLASNTVQYTVRTSIAVYSNNTSLTAEELLIRQRL